MTQTDGDRESQSRGHLWKIARWVITIVLLAIILANVPLDEVLAEAQRIQLRPAILGFIAGLIAIALAGIRWHVLLGPIGVRHPVWHTLGLRFIALFYNNFAPSTLGGDVAKVYMLSRGHETSKVETTASVLMDRAVGFVAQIVVGLCAAFILDVSGIGLLLAVLCGAAILAVLGAWGLSRLPDMSPAEGSGGWLRKIVARIVRVVRHVIEAMVRYRRHRAALVASFAVGVLIIVFTGLATLYWCLAFGFQLSVLEAVAVSDIFMMAAMVPIGINGLGWLEGAKIVLFAWVGMTEADALGVAVFQRVTMIVASLLGGLLQLLPEPYGPKV